MKSLNLVSEIRQASRGVLPDINKKRAAQSSSSHDLDDIAAGCRLGCVLKIMKNTYRWNFLCIHYLKRTAEDNSDKLCKASLPELHVPYYKTFQVDFLTQICDKTQRRTFIVVIQKKSM